ncbi:MAG: aminopeptidase [Candidatus Cloacimonetes bacterium]|nr:aminopeptidase [Candidatus Cloacimonadota bacterium]
MTIKNLYKAENQNSQEEYKKSIKSIKEIVKKTQNFEAYPDKKEFIRFYYDAGIFMLKICEFEKGCTPEHFTTESSLTLMEENKSFFEIIFPENYKKSWANPAYAVSKLGDNFGQLFSYFYTALRRLINSAFLHKRFDIVEWSRVYIEAFELIENALPDYEKLRSVITKIDAEYSVKDQQIRLLESYDPTFDYYKEIIENADLSDERYLFKFGCYINDDTIRISKHLQALNKEKVIELANLMADAYERGFITSDKDISKKSTAMMIYPAGFERAIKYLLPALKNKGIELIIRRPIGPTTNKQYTYDHRFDRALYLDEGLIERAKKNLKEAYELCKNYTDLYSGLIYFETFGEEPFSPKVKKECLKLNKEQQALMQQLQQVANQIAFTYTPREETSFSIISFPSPEIGENFEKIFNDTFEINTLKNEVYEPIQQKIIDALDTAEYAHIKGKGTNKTDLTVMLAKIDDPQKQTNFVNCTADVNVPLGEVFTSPKLKGTTGTLHIEDTYLRGLRFKNLQLVFKDGFIENYSCSNFDNEEDNTKYIDENILFPHKTLPMGEFAIGTNTLAYIVAQKYKILHLLPVLIIEKMGPHFAVGDTCFTFEEDKKVFNPNGKEIIARDNEKTILRKEDMGKAYTFTHIDITLPYEAIGHITAVSKNGTKIDIIRDERFVLRGTEKLNVPLDEYYT